MDMGFTTGFTKLVDQKVILDDGKAHIPSGRIKAWNGWLKLQREDD